MQKKISAERFTLFAGNPNIDTYPIQNSKYCIHCKLYLQKQKRTQNFSVFACYQFLLVTKVIYAFLSFLEKPSVILQTERPNSLLKSDNEILFIMLARNFMLNYLFVSQSYTQFAYFKKTNRSFNLPERVKR